MQVLAHNAAARERTVPQSEDQQKEEKKSKKKKKKGKKVSNSSVSWIPVLCKLWMNPSMCLSTRTTSLLANRNLTSRDEISSSRGPVQSYIVVFYSCYEGILGLAGKGGGWGSSQLIPDSRGSPSSTQGKQAVIPSCVRTLLRPQFIAVVRRLLRAHGLSAHVASVVISQEQASSLPDESLQLTKSD